MSEFLHFFSLTDVNIRSVVLGSVLLGATAGAIGCFALLRKRALIGDALAHSALPGVVIGFVISGGKVPIALLLGAMVTAWLGALAVNAISQRSKIHSDTAMAIVLSVLFATGIVGLTLVQKTGEASQSGLANFLFGRAASLLPEDVLHFGILAVINLIVLSVLFKEFKLIAFDSTFTRAIGLPAGVLDFLLTTLMVVAVVVGLQAVGVVLMAAMIITPAAAARLWTDRLEVMVWIAAALGGFSGIAGAYLSSLAPSMPTGPWMVLAVSVVFALSLLFAPRRGMLARLTDFLQLRRKTLDEHILKTFFHIGETRADFHTPVTVADLAKARFFPGKTLWRGLRGLRRAGLVETRGDLLSLTAAGREKAARIVRVHRLWEMYLSEYMHLPADHVHRDADQMEHVLTPELEARLEALLERPRVDPHGEPIPYPEGGTS
ncbi:MAG: metal ABC transporter permease [Calditrichota bacterium]